MNKQLKIRLRSLYGRGLMVVVFLAMLLAPIQGQVVQAKATSAGSDPVTMTVFATGLNNPRGLKFGPDGYLYVAEGGLGGTTSTVGQCTQVIAPIGPYTSGMTARISKISPSGERTTVVDGLPSSQTSAALGSLVSGVADVAFIKGNLYAILAGAGCSHGVAGIPNGVIKVNKNGTWKLIADLSAFQQSHPVKNPEVDDFEPDGTWYSMLALNNHLYAIEPNHGEMDRISVQGKIKRIIDISASQGHIVPTTIDYHHGRFYVGNLTTFPYVDGAAKVLLINKGGKIKKTVKGFSDIEGTVVDHAGNMYILENTTGNPMPTPGTGVIVKVNKKGVKETLVTGLSLPTGMTMGPDGNLYVSNQGFGYPAGQGQIVRINLNN